MESIIWLIAIAVFIIVEIVTLGLTTLWFACGAFVAFIASALGAGVPIQLTLFIVVSLSSLFFIRPYVARKFTRERTKTNYNSLYGKEGIVIEKIDNFKQTGAVHINGLDWTARAQNDEEKIDVGKKVVIHIVKGVKLIVEEVKEENK